MRIETEISLLEDILSGWQSLIGEEYQGYRNHVYRMVHFCQMLSDGDEEARQKILIAGAFHDLGIWIEDTVDYIPPSLPPMLEYLQSRGLEAWSEEIRLMITEHHKLRPYNDQAQLLVECFRQGDLVDFSIGLFRFGLAKAQVEEVKATFPNAGFHAALARRAGRWFLKHPFDPLPMMKW
ncbi:hypothetical protein A3195_06470 [Candidatus Thiodiazotropha endoloripes]|uniref:HD domain-containing protein n=1 Tax=Candidatus Thiodiazotropha endoloripes TaxID=1818881 RepID=UPI00083D88B1|nr:HD domain-containing protein [Candidatus Thiodiazotropha endoloripes]MCG7903210.1 HD domain-containing protein [Candidatus Thiodiazotropha weberae]MCG7915171.1 HD domain-containing protein [Candidatus Thiodiazotropha weberae]ODB84569.1 hypothetical protein A3193_17440 [Candidatus Thiodiazotropha endoloripes]ODB91065.1 hypothetical protein A3195_06470 [Candidatus Thiodiazotropha endoloripes]